jgi:hypothetical protein
MTSCKICGSKAEWFDVVDFAKTCSTPNVYPRGLIGAPIYYFRCARCSFIFTNHFDLFTTVQWNEQVYNKEYAEADPDYAEARPRTNARFLQLFLSGKKNSVIGLDFGGGNGLTAELLRQRGWQFDSYDPFGVSTVSVSNLRRYNVASAFEVFEHLTDPIGTTAKLLEMMSASDALIIIGTGVTDGRVDEASRLSWWYAAPRNGHVSLYSRRSLADLAGRFGLDFLSLSGGTHFMSRGKLGKSVLARFLFAKLALRMGLSLQRFGLSPRL